MRGFHDGGDGVEICGGGDQLEHLLRDDGENARVKGRKGGGKGKRKKGRERGRENTNVRPKVGDGLHLDVQIPVDLADDLDGVVGGEMAVLRRGGGG